MMKLFEEKTTPAARDLREHDEELPGLPEDVTVPDDLSGMPAPDIAGTSGGRRPIRWMRWVPVGLVLAAGGVTIALALNDGGTDLSADIVTTEVTEFMAEGPGSNSLNIPVRVDPVTEFMAEGPGSNSLNIPAE